VFAERIARLRLLLRPDPRRPARMWMRQQWPALLAMSLALLGVLWFDIWVASCGFEGCPSAGDIRAFRPGEGGRILDRNGALLGPV
jgi:hypothetical protein